jgi:hypothetical protein
MIKDDSTFLKSLNKLFNQISMSSGVATLLQINPESLWSKWERKFAWKPVKIKIGPESKYQLDMYKRHWLKFIMRRERYFDMNSTTDGMTWRKNNIEYQYMTISDYKLKNLGK